MGSGRSCWKESLGTDDEIIGYSIYIYICLCHIVIGLQSCVERSG